MLHLTDMHITSLTRFLINSLDFVKRIRNKERDLTRKRKITVAQIISFILNRPTITLYAEVKRVFHKMQGIEITKDALIKARKKIKYEAFREIFDLSAKEGLRFDPQDPFSSQFLVKGYRVFAIDGTDIRPEGSRELKNHFGMSCSQPKRAHARASILCEVTTGIVADAYLVPYTVGERKLASMHLTAFKEKGYQSDKDIVLFDRGYPSKTLLAELAGSGLFYVMRLAGSFSAEIDALSVPEATVEIEYKNVKYPQRVVRFPLSSGVEEVLLTNLPEADFAHGDFQSLYHMRWGIESKFNTLKNKLQLVSFSGKTLNSVMQDFYATMYVTNLVAAIRCQAQELLTSREEGQGYQSEHRVNENALISQLKDDLIVALCHENPEERSRIIEAIREEASRCYYSIRPTRPVPPRRSRETHHKISLPVKRAF